MKFKVLLALAIVAAFTGPARAEPRTVVVFFTEWSALIDDPAQSAITQAADLAKADNSPIVVTGYADTTGSEDANKLLSATRAQVVTDQLVADGVPSERIKQQAKGEIAAEGFKQESRRVSIVIGAE